MNIYIGGMPLCDKETVYSLLRHLSSDSSNIRLIHDYDLKRDIGIYIELKIDLEHWIANVKRFETNWNEDDYFSFVKNQDNIVNNLLAAGNSVITYNVSEMSTYLICKEILKIIGNDYSINHNIKYFD